MAKAKQSKSEELTPELLESLKEYATASELQELYAALWTKETLPDVIEPIAKTRAEAGRLLGVNERTISEWQSDPSFPGKAGDAGQANGFYPIEKIKAWRAQHRKPAAVAESDALAKLRERKLAADTGKREVELQRQLGELIPLSDAQAIIVDAINSARSQLEAWPSRIADQVPRGKTKLRNWLFKMATREVRKLLSSLEDADNLRSGDDDGGENDGGGPDLRPGSKKLRKKTQKKNPRSVGG